MSKRFWESQYYTIENDIKRCNICKCIFHKNKSIVHLQQHIISYHPIAEVQNIVQETAQKTEQKETERWTKSDIIIYLLTVLFKYFL